MKKLGISILLVMTLMLALVGIGNAAEAWDKPASGGVVSGTYNINITFAGGDATTAKYVNWTYTTVGGNSGQINNGNVLNRSLNTLYDANYSFDSTAFSDGNYTLNATIYDVSWAVLASKTNNMIFDNNNPTLSSATPADNTMLAKGNTTVAGFQVTSSEFCTSGSLLFNGQTYTMTNTSQASTTWQYTTAISNVPEASYAWTATINCPNSDTVSGTYNLALNEKGKGVAQLSQTQQQVDKNNGLAAMLLIGAGAVAVYLIFRQK